MESGRNNICRSCGYPDCEPILSLGRTPIADRLLSKDQLTEPERTAPLGLMFCRQCSLVQIVETVSPEVLFLNNYPYFSSVSPALLKHSEKNALEIITSKALGTDRMVVEIASNDGYMLKNFVKQQIPVLGIDPAQGPAEAAQKANIPTLCEFFGKELAIRLWDQGVAADVVIANNVLAHVPDVNGFVQGIRMLLKDTGTAFIEVPYLKDLIDKVEFDTIYHQHVYYFSVTALDALFRRNALFQCQ